MTLSARLAFWSGVLGALAGAARCDTVSFLSPTTTEQPFGSFYGQSASDDGPERSLPHFISGTGVFAGNPYAPAAQLPFYGDSGSALLLPSGFWFHSGGPSQTALLMEIAGWRDGNTLGWYNTANSADFGVIFQGSDQANPSNSDFTTTPVLRSFQPSTDWGLWLLPNYQAPITASAIAQDGMLSLQHPEQFGLFRDDTQDLYYIGVEDTLVGRDFAGGDRDYNDMIFSLKNTPQVPEPSTVLLLGTVVLGLGLLRLRAH
ncbi:MAG: PEP-CTERM sorting domain-containing protein [Acidobacteria bacterium]|nr:PEP-CTERM sorting domain-containing protein [Acidobacteriota bacterium]